MFRKLTWLSHTSAFMSHIDCPNLKTWKKSIINVLKVGNDSTHRLDFVLENKFN